MVIVNSDLNIMAGDVFFFFEKKIEKVMFMKTQNDVRD